MKELSIKNSKNQKISIIIDKANNQLGLAFVMHSLGGFKEQPHIQAFARAFKNNCYTVLRFDTTNSFGQSDGEFPDATVTNYYEDLEDVIAWSKTQAFYQEPFVLCGHSLGAICVALYAENYPAQIKALAPISTVVSGELSMRIEAKKDIDNWRRTGWKTTVGYSSGKIKKLKWSHMEDRLKYDLLRKVNRLTMPVLLLAGENDSSTPLKHQQILFNKLPGKKALYAIKGAPHTFREKEHIQKVEAIISRWIKSIK